MLRFMKFCFTALLLLSFSTTVFCQQKDSLINGLNSLNQTDSAEVRENVSNTDTCSKNTGISFKSYFVLLGGDLKQQVTAPFHQTGKEWFRIGMYTASVAAISAITDEPVQRFAVKIHDSSQAVSNVSSYATKFGGRYELYTLAALGGYSVIFKDKKMQTTTLLATQAYITSGLIESVVKYITGRQRPSYYDPNHPEPEPYFHGPAFSGGKNVYGQKINTSFPSGHTTVVFAVATVFAKEYKNVGWVPPVAYGAASLVGLSRITENKHWTSDVIVGATLGFLCGRQVVNNYHRYTKLKTSPKGGTVAFNLNYNGYNFEPGLVYTFRR